MRRADYEYRTCRAISEAGIAHEVNELACDGWRVVGFTTSTLRGEEIDQFVCLLERPTSVPAERRETAVG
ncbi:MAG: hypothetical protein RIE08_07410 [Acidimicrobiales bacterium]